MNGRVRIVLGTAIGLFFAWLTLRDVVWQDLLAAFERLQASQIMLALLCISAAYAVRVYRWTVMLRVFSPGVRYGQAAGPFLASFAINNLVPLRAGDIARTFAFERRLEVAPSRVAATLIMERLWDLLALLVFLALGLGALEVIEPVLRDMAVAAVSGCALALLIVLFSPRYIYQILVWLHRDLRLGRIGLVARVLKFGRSLMISLRQLSGPGVSATMAGLSLLSWLLEGGVFFVLALRDLANPLGAWFALATSTLMTMVPGTPGHVGTFDFGAKLGYVALGMTPEAATVAAIVVHAMIWLPVTAAGGLWLMAQGRRRKLVATLPDISS